MKPIDWRFLRYLPSPRIFLLVGFFAVCLLLELWLDK